MNRTTLILLMVLFSILPDNSFSWGFWAHQRINRMAVFSLPPPMFGFYKYFIDYLTIHAVDPDKRRYAVEGEAACHYIDLDRYGDRPFDSIPRKWKDAVERYSEDTLMAHGIVPWHIERTYYRLTMAMRDKNLHKILRYSADLGHYVGDAHVPLHCTSNYNGQLTNQHGIHGFWESRIPELFGEEFDYLTGRCVYIQDPLQFAWEIVRVSYHAHDSVLSFERKLSDSFPADRKYAVEIKGNTPVTVYSQEYSGLYHRMLDGMVERRMRESVYAVACLWYTAWVNAGQPDLTSLLDPALPGNLISPEDSIPAKKIIPHGGHID
jgi:hypothetical protein